MDRDNAARKKAVATMIKRAQLRQKLADPVENKKSCDCSHSSRFISCVNRVWDILSYS